VTDDEFWALIEGCRDSVTGEDGSTDMEPFRRRLEARLRAMSLEELAGFRPAMDAVGVYKPHELWRVVDPEGRAITGQDSWEAFGGWLIAQGREFHDAVLADHGVVLSRPFRYGDVYQGECVTTAADGIAMARTGIDLDDLFPDWFDGEGD